MATKVSEPTGNEINDDKEDKVKRLNNQIFEDDNKIEILNSQNIYLQEGLNNINETSEKYQTRKENIYDPYELIKHTIVAPSSQKVYIKDWFDYIKWCKEKEILNILDTESDKKY